MRNLLKLLSLALAGFIVYQLIRRYLAERAEYEGAAPPRPMGRVQGAAMTAGGSGAVQRTLGADGSSASERVGRGVVRRS